MKYLTYSRVSSKLQDVEMQTNAMNNHFKTKYSGNSYRRVDFSDPDTSSGIHMSKRAGLQEMLGNIKPFDVVIVHSIDRLSRDIVEMVTIYRLIVSKGAKVYSISESDLDELKVGIMGVVAQHQRTSIRLKVKEGLQNKKDKGHRYCGKLPYGFSMHETKLIPIRKGSEIVMKRGILVPIKEEQSVIKKMVKLFDSGYSYDMISKTLAILGYMNREGNPFHRTSIARIVARAKESTSQDQHLHEQEQVASL